ncbi:MAG: phenylalanine--tRNA ligase subunit alpha, partial [Phycisphaerae bacterium]|nr:phenylalanine--tRNA ligase subunit alpha [Phycisphaerae bacterium]
MLDVLHELETTALAELDAQSGSDALEEWRISYLGTKGKLRAVMPLMKSVPPDQKPAVGKRLNEVKTTLETAFREKKDAVADTAEAGPAIDVTEPGFPCG